MDAKKKRLLIKLALLLCLSSILLFEILIYPKLKESTNNTIALLQEGYSNARGTRYYYPGEADRRLNSKGVNYGGKLVTLLDSIYKRYSYKFSETDHWNPDKLHSQNVIMTNRDIVDLNIALQGFCESFDSLFKEPHAIFYKDTISLDFSRAKNALERLKHVIPKDGKVELYKSFTLHHLNGNEFAMIFSEWKFRFDDFVHGYGLDMEPVHDKICEESLRKWKTDYHAK